jgi:ElaB/YqjD/DUF883 family membrane-anchored ribosome-binding protein
MNNPEHEDDLESTTTNRLKQTTQQAASDLRGQAGKIAENVSEKASGMLSAAKEKLGNMSDTARSAATAARDRAGELLGDARDSAQEVYATAREHMATWSEDGLQYVRENPAKSVFTALLAGVVLGFTLRRH